MIQFRDLKKQNLALKPQIDAAVENVMLEANFISGHQVDELESRLAGYVNVKHCVTCANGTDALKLAELVCDIEPGDAVFVPDFTFFSSAETVAELRATPIFVDVDENTFNIDPIALETAIENIKCGGKSAAKAVVVVDLFGLPANYDKIRKIADKYGLLIIEDGAQGFGGSINGRRACSFGDIATTSFFPAKPLGCYGDGGAVFTNDDKADALLRSLCVHGKSADDKYNNLRLGMNSRLDTMQAAILDVKLTAFEEYELAAVNRVAEMYDEKLKKRFVTPTVPQHFISSWAQYTLRFENQTTRDRYRQELKANGIPTMVYYPRGMHEQGAFKAIPYEGQCPTTERLSKTVLSLPIHPYMEEKDVEYICDRLLSV